MRRQPRRKKQFTQTSRRRKILPAVFILLSLLLMVLPLESPVASVKAVLAYIFIPQIRAAHSVVEYADGVSDTVKGLLSTQQENEILKEEMNRLRLENAQAQEIFAENERLTAALNLRAERLWNGVWAKTAYREPSQWNSVVIDKGQLDGVQERAAAIAQKDGNPVLAGVVVESGEHTAKVLLLSDEDFSAAVYADQSGEDALLVGGGAGALKMQYLPVLSKLQAGEKVYTSSSSSIFPAGILVGKVLEVQDSEPGRTARSARVEPEAEAADLRELFIIQSKQKGR